MKPDVVQKLRLQVTNQQYCLDQWKGKNTVADSQLCAEAEDRYKSPCPGDSGGPLMLETTLRGQSEYYLVSS